MQILHLEAFDAAPIRDYQSFGTAAALIGHGTGRSHVHWLTFEPGGAIGPHQAGFDQLLIPLSGSGWVSGSDGSRHEIARGRAALISLGELHSKGSDSGMTALMIQCATFTLHSRASAGG